MTVSRTLARTAAAVALATAASVTAVAPALATDAHGSGAVPVGSGSGNQDNQGACYVVANSNYMGMTCPGGSYDDPLKIKAILGKDDLPTCWDEPMTQDDLNAINQTNTPDSPEVEGTTWYWHRCLKGIDPKTLQITGDIQLPSGPRPVHPGDDVVLLTQNQRQLINAVTQYTPVPFPKAVVSPNGTPRVGSWVSFFDGREPQGDPVVQVAGYTLTAHETSIDIDPLGPDAGPTLNCPGTGHQAVAGEKPEPGGNCWYKYLKSSASKYNNVYRVRITSHWQVSVTGPNYSNPNFTTFTKPGVTLLPVTEVQAINVE